MTLPADKHRLACALSMTRPTWLRRLNRFLGVSVNLHHASGDIPLLTAIIELFSKVVNYNARRLPEFRLLLSA